MKARIVLASLSLLTLLLVSGWDLNIASAQTSSTGATAGVAFSNVASGQAATSGQLRKIGTTIVAANSHIATRAALSKTLQTPPNDRSKPISGGAAAAAINTVSAIPSVSSLDSVVNSAGGAASAKGLNALDNGLVNGFDLEPPDQGLCVGNGYVVEAINLVVRVYTTNLQGYSSDIALNTLAGLPLSLFTSDPRCIYDTGTGHWFLSFLAIYTSPSFQGFEYLAVSTTPSPVGSWNIYALNVTDSFKKGSFPGQSNDPGCPCFGDQPLLGASRDAIVISTNEYPIVGAGFNGAQLYFISKQELALGYNFVTFVHLNTLHLLTPDGNCATSAGLYCWYSVNPAASPTTSQYDNTHLGTEYALSSLDFTGAGDNRIAVWTFTNLASLFSFNPKLYFNVKVGTGLEKYIDPIDANGDGFMAAQKKGPIPLGDTVFSTPPNSGPYPGCVAKCAEGPIQTNADGMFDNVVYAQGALWGAINTVVREQIGRSSSLHAGIAYWVVNAFDGSLSLASQGYVAASGEDVMFPAIGVGPTGDAVITFTLTGKDYYPSTGYGLITKSSGGLVNAKIYVSAMGRSPQDGFTEYACIQDNCAAFGLTYRPRWGDYSWAVWSNGKVYFSTEYIQYPNCGDSAFMQDSSCGGTRDTFANWGTSLNSVTP